MLEDILENRGLKLEDLEFIQKLPEYILPFYEEAKKLFLKHCLKGSIIGVQFDVDVDGLCAGKIMCEYLNRMGIRPLQFINKNKVHGINEEVIEWVKTNKIDFLIVVDAGTNDLIWHEELKAMEVDLLVLDHHTVEEETLNSEMATESKVIITCNIDEFDNKDLSGTGVVYRFIRDINKELNLGSLDVLEPWVGLSVLSDVCSMINKENRYYVDKLYKFRDKLILFKNRNFYGSELNFFAFGVIPMLNASIRMGREDLAMEIIQCNQPKVLSKLVMEAEMLIKKQRELVELLLGKVKIVKGDNIVIARLPKDFVYPNLAGLLASKVKSKYEKPAIVIYRKDNNNFKGSFRGSGYPYLDYFNSIGIEAKGHQFACGVNIKSEIANEIITELVKEAPKSEIKEQWDLEVTDSRLFSIEKYFNQYARFNEFSGKDNPPIRIKINITKPLTYKIDSKSYRRLRYTYFEVMDFNMEDIPKDYIIVYPVLSESDEFKLIRYYE